MTPRERLAWRFAARMAISSTAILALRNFCPIHLQAAVREALPLPALVT
jgi:hypothetical protein